MMNANDRFSSTDCRVKVNVAARTAIAVLAVAGAAAGVWYSANDGTNTPAALLADAEASLAIKDYAAARDFAERSLRRFGENGDRTAALIVAGKAAAAQNDLAGALEYFGQVAADSSPEASEALVAAGELAYKLGRASEAEKHWRAVLVGDRGHQLANSLLAYLLSLEGRSFEAAPFHFFPLKSDVGTPLETLSLLSGDEPVVANGEQMGLFRLKAPDDLAPRIADARVALIEKRLLEAQRLLERIVRERPDMVEAHARYGELLLAQAPQRLAQWSEKLPAAAEEHPVVWFVRGQAAEREQQLKAAARAYWRAIQADPTHAGATYRLGQVLKALGRPEADAIAHRAAALRALATVADDLRRAPPTAGDEVGINRLESAATLCEQLGRPWEACAWADMARRVNPTPAAWAEALLGRLMPRLEPTTPRTLDEANPGRTLDLSSYPLPSLAATSAGPNASSDLSTNGKGVAASIAFEDRAARLGIDFCYYADADPSGGQTRLIETTGGGVAAIDFDADGWPDLYFTQGADWPSQPGAESPRRPLDALYRNLSGERAVNVTQAACLGDADYSQGVSVGDFDCDGFHDLYVANIGRNRLYRNLGDGTFEEVSHQMQTAGHFWTTSCLIADVNADGLPDLYDVNYVANRDLDAAVCSRGDEIGGCRPGAFEAAQDRLFVNRGDGWFTDVSESAGIFARDGMGLGIVAGDFTGGDGIELFVANDGFPNFFFARIDRPDSLLFENQAAWNGLAVDRLGKAQACMGVAAGDPNGDGRLDLCVTNFHNESSTLYVQRADDLFEDATAFSGLQGPSREMLGFGCQFLDADLDGAEDLLVTNGHVFDMTEHGALFAMRAQFFHNRGDGAFDELHAETLGDFFRTGRRGRGLARLDWDRDGRDDAAITHLDAAASLLVNRTADEWRSLSLRLVGVRSSRDAIGAVVAIEVATPGGERRFVRHLTAGDGYQCSNQRRLTFGLGSGKPRSIEIRWPSGARQAFANPPPAGELACVEGADRLISLAR